MISCPKKRLLNMFSIYNKKYDLCLVNKYFFIKAKLKTFLVLQYHLPAPPPPKKNFNPSNSPSPFTCQFSDTPCTWICTLKFGHPVPEVKKKLQSLKLTLAFGLIVWPKLTVTLLIVESLGPMLQHIMCKKNLKSLKINLKVVQPDFYVQVTLKY